MGVYEKLMSIQQTLKAPKDKTNSFGGYKYRSAESILEAVKPILAEQKCVLTLSDVIEGEGNRIYVTATATLTDIEDGSQVVVCASAREAEFKKGMDDSQITGTASSYARKYAMNGLFAIDDTKDADTDEYRNEAQNRAKARKPNLTNPKGKISDTDAEVLKTILMEKGKDTAAMLGWIERESGYRAESVDDLTREQYAMVMNVLG